MTRNSGKPSEDSFEALIKSEDPNAFIFRITDSAEVRGRAGAGWTKAQPADYVVTIRGKTFFAEAKSSSNKTSFPFANITKEQLGYAKLQEKAGGAYYFFLHSLSTNSWFMVPAGVIIAAIKAGKRSFKWSELKEWSLMNA